MEIQNSTFVMLPQETLAGLLATQQDILAQLKELNTRGPTGVPVKYLTAAEFMRAVSIKRTKLTALIQANRIKVVRKRRRVYIPLSEVDRFFHDNTIQ